MLRRSSCIAVTLFGVGLAWSSGTARADEEEPVIAIPTLPGVPVVIHGCDASYTVVEGDWGPGASGPWRGHRVGCAPLLPNAVYSERNSYHPRYGETDGAPAYVLAPNARIIHVADGK